VPCVIIGSLGELTRSLNSQRKVRVRALTGEPTRAFSQKADLLEVFRWEPSTYFTNLQAEVAEEIVLFLRNNGKDTGQETYTHWRSGDVWRLVRVSRAAFHKFAESQKLCSSRYVWKVMRKLVALGYVRVFTLKGQKGYGLVVNAMKRHKVSASRYEKFMAPLRKTAS